MPESYDKHGPPKLWAKVKCLVPGCDGEKLIWPPEAERLARQIERGLAIRYVLGRFKCQKCRHNNASLSFHLAYPGKKPWDKPAMPWRNEGERAAYMRQRRAGR